MFNISIKMLRLIIKFFLAFLICEIVNCDNVQIPELGTIIGSTTTSIWTNQKIYQFLGIPYAEPPINELRFKAPKERLPFSSPFNATEFGRPCPTNHLIKTLKPEQYKEAEDCLHLSIYSTNLNTNANRPVMFFIHGGGFEIGSSNQYPGTFLLEKDIVYVATNYRLGPLGFLSTNTQEIPGNAGFLDIIMAMKWVKKYIKNFGGNPNRITIFGESAGAALVSALMLSSNDIAPSDLFHGAIVQSGSVFGTWAFDDEPIKRAGEIFDHVDKSKCQRSATMEACFMDLDVVSLLQAYHEHKTSSKKLRTGTRLSYSDTSFPIKPNDLLNGKIKMRNIPLMAGVTKTDGLFLVAPIYQRFAKEYDIENNKTFATFDLINQAAEEFGLNDASGTANSFLIKSLFTQHQIANGNIKEMLAGFKDLGCDILFKGPVLKAAQAHAKFNANQTFLYTFDYRGENSAISLTLNSSSIFYNGVHHGDDLFYLFPLHTINGKLNAADTNVAKLFVDLWTSFAINGVPSSSNAPKWPALKDFTGPYIHLNAASKVDQDFLDEFTVNSREYKSAGTTQTKLLGTGLFILNILSTIMFAIN